MVYFGNSILVKENGTLYFGIPGEYSYCWSTNFNIISKLAVLYNTKIGGIWNGQTWIFTSSRQYKNLLRKYHNV